MHFVKEKLSNIQKNANDQPRETKLNFGVIKVRGIGFYNKID